ncbi:TPA: cell division protein FtsZ [Candidatus Poribacteria bacterium]|nr:cell division protein FtsZ [Candidatus Poribacteria bacterium]
MLEFENDRNESIAVIKVIGVGGGGCNAINTMIKNNMKGVQFYAVNTDIKSLRSCFAQEKIQIGATLTKGLGAGSDPLLGQKCAEEDREKLQQIVEGADIVFVTAGLGGGTGTGASPIVAELAKDTGALTIAVVTKPFDFEGPVRLAQAESGIKELKKNVDALIAIPNQKLIANAEKSTSIIESFRMADDVLYQGVQSISDLVVETGYIVVDFRDVKTIMTGAGTALMGIGEDSGENRAVRAAQKAISNPLLDGNGIQGATGVLVNFTGEDIQTLEVEEAMSMIRSSADSNAHIIWGLVTKDNFERKIKITVIATGFGKKVKDRDVIDDGEETDQADIDEIIKDTFAHTEVIKRKRPLMRGGLSSSGDREIEDELNLPKFLRSVITSKNSAD